MAPTIGQLRDQLRSATERRSAVWGVVSSGRSGLDAVLPAGGFRRGTLVEWTTADFGSGATTLALCAACEAAGDHRPLVIIDRRGWFFPPSLPTGIDRERLLLVRCERDDDEFWACDQALRTSGVGAVVIWLSATDERRLRRWQLAAERSGALGLIVRHLPSQPEACFSDVRLLVTPSCVAGGRRVHLELLRTRQGRAGAVVEVSLDDDADFVPAADVASRRATGS